MASTMKVWVRLENYEPEKIAMCIDADIDDLKEKILAEINQPKRKFIAYFQGVQLSAGANIPGNTRPDTPILIKRIQSPTVLTAEDTQFAAPSTYKELRCKGRPCAKCGKCRDQYFAGDSETWNWMVNFEHWTDKDRLRWCNNYGWTNFKTRAGFTCHGTRDHNIPGSYPHCFPPGYPDPIAAGEYALGSWAAELNPYLSGSFYSYLNYCLCADNKKN